MLKGALPECGGSVWMYYEHSVVSENDRPGCGRRHSGGKESGGEL